MISMTTDKRRLYTVTVTFQYVVRAENESHAKDYASDSATGLDLTNNCEVARTVQLLPDSTFVVCYPDKPDGKTIWDCQDPEGNGGCLIDKAIADEKVALLAEAEFLWKQGKLFDE